MGNVLLDKLVSEGVPREIIDILTESLNDSNTATFETLHNNGIIINPLNIEHVRLTILAASKLSIKIHTVSKGYNWGYGSRTPLFNNGILMNLSKMNKILELNEEYGYVTIEPGVTYRQLFEFLREKKSKLLVGMGGSSSEASLIGNSLERGIGAGPNGDRLLNIMDLEVVLPNGSILHTGSDGSTKGVYSRRQGPLLEGFFTQSNFGVITKMTYSLKAIPKYSKALFFSLRDRLALKMLLDRLKEGMLYNLFPDGISFYNDFRVLTFFMTYPFEDERLINISNQDKAVILLKDLGLDNLIGEWNGDCLIEGNSIEEVEAKYELIYQAIFPVAKNIKRYDFNEEIMLMAMNSKNQVADLKNDFIRNFMLSKYVGLPNQFAIKQAYWRKKNSYNEMNNPDKDHCGLLWLAPVLPIDSDLVDRITEKIKSEIEGIGLQPIISLIKFGKVLYLFASILWDRDLQEEEKRAMKVYEKIILWMKNLGVHAYRGSTHSISNNIGYELTSEHDFLKILKRSSDLNNILNPNKYSI